MDSFNYYAPRAHKARLNKVLNHSVCKISCYLLMLLLLGTSALLFYLQNYLFWTSLGLIFPCLILRIWAKYDLSNIKIGKTEDINSLLSANCLALMDKNPSPTSLAALATKTPSGQFLAIRFAITPPLLQELAKSLGTDPAPIFKTARDIYHSTHSEYLNGAIIAAALILTHPNHQQILNSLKLSTDDLYQAIRWRNHLTGLIKGAKKRPHTGGIARDLAFGYIPLLQHFGINLSKQREFAPQTQIYQPAHQTILTQMIQTFSKQGRQNIALIGDYGSGRSAIVDAFAETLLNADINLPSNLQFHQIFLLDVSALISATDQSTSLEGLVTRLFNEAYAAKNIILCLDNAHLFFEEGPGSIDLTNTLLPILEAGNLRIILMLDQQRYLKIAAKASALANSLNKIIVEPADETQTLLILENQLPFIEYKHHVVYTYLALREAYQLSNRYIHDVAMPGKARLLLESAADYANDGLVTAESVQQAIEHTQGVKIQTPTKTEDRQQLLNLEDLIHERMINQDTAVKAVSSALRRAAAGVRNPNRPIGTFLFLGPTGVGKTELAKALNTVYFHATSPLIRLDLNEFVASSDVSRLIADATTDELSLTAQVTKRPFSVILLDEIEKAHPQVLTTLLQVLDEGILRDINNREVSFRDAIIIATSNAGADQIRSLIDQGTPLAQAKDQLTNALIKSGEFKPEFLNRFDEICLFSPLSKPDLLKVIDLILQSVNQTLANQKITVLLDNTAKTLLVERGYDPQLGARPLRRTVQQSVENFVAQAVLSGQATPGSTITINADQIASQLKNSAP